MVRMGQAWVGVLALALAGIFAGGGSAAGSDEASAWSRVWVAQTGTQVPPDVAPLLARLDAEVGPEIAHRVSAGAADDNNSVYGDIWSVCLSATSGCDVMDIYGTASHNLCERIPAHPEFWLYVTVPSVVGVRATGAAVGTWVAHTVGTDGGYRDGMIAGLSCTIMDQAKVSVVYSDGVAMYRS